MNIIEQTKQLREISIESAVYGLIKTLNPFITIYDYHERVNIDVVTGSGEYTVTLDGKPLVLVVLSNMQTFTFEILA